MAKPGTPSKMSTEGSPRSADTRRSLVEAAIETLKIEGFGGTSARAIAERAGLNQGLIFYHFGSVLELLLAALDAVSDERMLKFGAAVNSAATPAELTDIAVHIFQEDLDSGHVTVLAEMIAGASSTPGLGVEVAARLGPWFTFAENAIEKSFGDSPLSSLVPSSDVAYVIVALYLGVEMLTHLDGNRESALRVFGHAQQLVALLGAFSMLTPPRATT
ncbi:MAG TPA: TetR/AcrR family transcriptional regulator [Acidimicrobiales bacterium]|jgi:AcrR family transcriptional regulator|nr:TetR/AcrR family transcriptional regulator [Acidimicrobiales bacterium]